MRSSARAAACGVPRTMGLYVRPKSNTEPRMGLSGTLMMGLPVCSMRSATSVMKLVSQGLRPVNSPSALLRPSPRPLVGTPRQDSTMTASTPSHSATALSTRGPTSPPAAATMSSGLCRL